MEEWHPMDSMNLGKFLVSMRSERSGTDTAHVGSWRLIGSTILIAFVVATAGWLELRTRESNTASCKGTKTN
jgi:hypothetical protein